jgi:N-acetyl-anhydromuramyl-L-alanine amidase AmpD
MVGTLSSTDSTFQKPGGVSAHYGIEDGNVHQYVRDQDTAYHAGNWAMNLRSIGIEHSADPNRPASASTLETSAQLIAAKCKEFNIPCDRSHIIKHSEVVATQCPGTIPIDQLVKRANEIIGGSEVTDLFTCRRIAYSVWGINGIYKTDNALNGDWDATFKADPAWLGADTNTCLQTRFDAPEAKAYRAYLAQSPGFEKLGFDVYKKK